MKKITVTIRDETYGRLLSTQLQLKLAGVGADTLAAAVDHCVEVAANCRQHGTPTVQNRVAQQVGAERDTVLPAAQAVVPRDPPSAKSKRQKS
jgi:hypothetical protein